MTILITTKQQSVKKLRFIFINETLFKAGSINPSSFIAFLHNKPDADVKRFSKSTFEDCLRDVKNYLNLQHIEIVSVDKVFNMHEHMEIHRGRESVLLSI